MYLARCSLMHRAPLHARRRQPMPWVDGDCIGVRTPGQVQGNANRFIVGAKGDELCGEGLLAIDQTFRGPQVLRMQN